MVKRSENPSSREPGPSSLSIGLTSEEIRTIHTEDDGFQYVEVTKMVMIDPVVGDLIKITDEQGQQAAIGEIVSFQETEKDPRHDLAWANKTYRIKYRIRPD